MRWPTNFYNFKFEWTDTARIEIHTTKAWSSQLENLKNAIWTLEERYAIKFCFKLEKNAMQLKLDLLLWPKDQETEFPVEACWLSQTQEGQTKQIHPQTFDNPFFFFFFFDSTGMIYMHLVPAGQTVNKQYYGSSGRDSVGRVQHSSNRVSGISTGTMHQSTTPSLS